MRQLGGFLILMGAGSMLLHLIHFDFILMSWVDLWGPTPGWIIRASILTLGIVLLAAAGAAAGRARNEAKEVLRARLSDS